MYEYMINFYKYEYLLHTMQNIGQSPIVCDANYDFNKKQQKKT